MCTGLWCNRKHVRFACVRYRDQNLADPFIFLTFPMDVNAAHGLYPQHYAHQMERRTMMCNMERRVTDIKAAGLRREKEYDPEMDGFTLGYLYSDHQTIESYKESLKK